MSTYGIKITKPGYDADTSTDPREWAMYSDYPMFKVASKGTSTMPAVSPSSVTIPHNLGYNPICLVFCQMTFYTGAGKFHRATGDLALNQTFVNNTTADLNNLYIEQDTGAGEDVYYYILHDETISS